MANGNFGGGVGTQGSPYLIEDLADLCKLYAWQTIHTKVTFYKLVNDVDASKEELAKLSLTTWTPIPGALNGEGDRYIGGIDFNFKKIKNLYINKPGIDNVGFFSSTNVYGALGIIKRARIENATVLGESNVGIFCGHLASGSLDGVFVSGNVAGNTNVGGMIGKTGASYVSNCLSDTTVVGYSTVGGLIGLEESGYVNAITKCITKGKVEGSLIVGGIVGKITNTTTNVITSKNVSLCSEIIRKSGTNLGFGRVAGNKATANYSVSNSKALKDMKFKY